MGGGEGGRAIPSIKNLLLKRRHNGRGVSFFIINFADAKVWKALRKKKDGSLLSNPFFLCCKK